MWRQAWIFLVGLAGVGGAVAACWIAGAWLDRLFFPNEGKRESWETPPHVLLLGFVALLLIGGLLTVVYELGCAIVGCRA